MFNELRSKQDLCGDVTVGYALDGFPLAIANVDVSEDLDECGGMITKDGYKYFFTDKWPYSIRCFQGSIQMSLPEFYSDADIAVRNCPEIYKYRKYIEEYIRLKNNGLTFPEFLYNQVETGNNDKPISRSAQKSSQEKFSDLKNSERDILKTNPFFNLVNNFIENSNLDVLANLVQGDRTRRQAEDSVSGDYSSDTSESYHGHKFDKR